MNHLKKCLVSAFLSLVLLLTYGCGNNKVVKSESETSAIEPAAELYTEDRLIEPLAEAGDEGNSLETESEDWAENYINDASSEKYDVEYASSDTSQDILDEYGVYDSKEDVALYIVTYDRLPSNYITKKEAKKLGWSGGSLEEYAPGKCIGGDYFGNYEGNLPEDNEYHECDIDTLGKKSRGAKRLVYSDDGYIYYTEDHYETFELLYEP